MEGMDQKDVKVKVEEEQNPDFKVRVARIVGLQFGLLSPDYLRQIGVHIYRPAINSQKLPVDGGLNDGRMGSNSRSMFCSTCSETFELCQRHPGYLELVRPILNPEHLKNILKILRCFCYYCSRLLVRGHAALYQQFQTKRFSTSSFHASSFLLELSNASRKIPVCSTNIDGPAGYLAQQKKIKQTIKKRSKEGKRNTSSSNNGLGQPESEDVDMQCIRSGQSFVCGACQPTYVLEGLNIRATDSQGNAMPADAETILQILTNIRDEDIAFLGLHAQYSHPKWMVFTLLPIMPQTAHEKHEGSGSWGVDEATGRLQNIIRLNNELGKEMQQRVQGISKKEKKERAKRFQRSEADMYRELQIQISCMISGDASIQSTRNLPTPDQIEQLEVFQNKDRALTPEENKQYQDLLVMLEMQSKSQPLARFGRGITNTKGANTIRKKWGGKSGMFRKHMKGKRKDFSGRSVITIDPYLAPNEVRPPIEMMQKLTDRIAVTKYTARDLTSCIRNGPKIYPGAVFIEFPDNTVCKVSSIEHTSVTLQPGWYIIVHLKDGSQLIFNRHPSLHRESIMAHKARRGQTLTIGKSASTCTPYNADFDGDEMNLHKPQRSLAGAEAAELLAVDKHILAVKNGRPLIAPIQDTPNGAWLVTDPGRLFSYQDALQYLMQCRLWEGHNHEMPVVTFVDRKTRQKYVTGHSIVSCLLPPSLYVSRRMPRHRISQDALVMYSDPKNMYDSSLWIQDGFFLFGRLTKDRISDILLTIVKQFGDEQGVEFIFRIERTMYEMLTVLGSTFSLLESQSPCPEQVQQILEQLRGWMQSDEAKTATDEVQCDVINAATKRIEDLVIGTAHAKMVRQRWRNSLIEIVASGAKAKAANIRQIWGISGQQFSMGKRFAQGISHSKYADPAAAHGFVDRNYFDGLTAAQYFFHGACGIEGIADMAVRVPDTGYMSRKMQRGMEQYKITHTGSVVDDTGQLLQVAFGDDGFNTARLEYTKMNILACRNEQEFAQRYQPHDLAQNDADMEAALDEWEILILAREQMLIWKGKQQHIASNQRSLSTNCFSSPIRFEGLLHRFEKQTLPEDDAGIVSLLECKMQVDALLRMLQDVYHVQPMQIFWILIRDWFCSRFVIRKYRWSAQTLRQALAEVERQFTKARTVAGDMQGSDTGHRLAEPLTQLSFNTFHFTGSQNTLVGGVPRFKELIDMRGRISTPSMDVYFWPEWQKDAAFVQDLARKLPVVSLKHVVCSSTGTQLVDAEPWKRQWPLHLTPTMIHTMGNYKSRWSDYVMQIQLDKSKCMDKKLLPRHIMKRLKKYVHRLFENYGFASEILDSISFWDCSKASDAVWYVRFLFQEECSPWNFWWRLHMQEGKDDEAEAKAGKEDNHAKEGKKPKRITQKQKLQRPLESKPQPKHLRQFYSHLLDRLYQVHLMGLPGIRAAEMRKSASGECIIKTYGSNLKQLFYHYPAVDSTRTCSNDIMEMSSVFGRNVASSVTEQELWQVLQGATNIRHAKLASQIQAASGTLLGMHRFGCMQETDSAVQKMCFEVPADVLNHAITFSVQDNLTSVSANSILGNTIKMGGATVELREAADCKQVIEPNIFEKKYVERRPQTQAEIDLFIKNELHLWQQQPSNIAVADTFFEPYLQPNDELTLSSMNDLIIPDDSKMQVEGEEEEAVPFDFGGLDQVMLAPGGQMQEEEEEWAPASPRF
jgi:DNA-directed RNA polymerase beta' subunit